MHNLGHHLAMMLSGLIKGLMTVPAWILVGLTGYSIWENLGSPFMYVVGLPLMLIGLSMALISFYEMVVSLVSSRWRSTHGLYKT